MPCNRISYARYSFRTFSLPAPKFHLPLNTPIRSFWQVHGGEVTRI